MFFQFGEHSHDTIFLYSTLTAVPNYLFSSYASFPPTRLEEQLGRLEAGGWRLEGVEWDVFFLSFFYQKFFFSDTFVGNVSLLS